LTTSRGGSTLGQGAGTCPHIHLLPPPLPPQIQKLGDGSDVISEVPKCSKIQIFLGSAPDSAGGAYSAHPEPLADGEGVRFSLPREVINSDIEEGNWLLFSILKVLNQCTTVPGVTKVLNYCAVILHITLLMMY